MQIGPDRNMQSLQAHVEVHALADIRAHAEGHSAQQSGEV